MKAPKPELPEGTILPLADQGVIEASRKGLYDGQGTYQESKKSDTRANLGEFDRFLDGLYEIVQAIAPTSEYREAYELLAERLVEAGYLTAGAILHSACVPAKAPSNVVDPYARTAINFFRERGPSSEAEVDKSNSYVTRGEADLHLVNAKLLSEHSPHLAGEYVKYVQQQGRLKGDELKSVFFRYNEPCLELESNEEIPEGAHIYSAEGESNIVNYNNRRVVLNTNGELNLFGHGWIDEYRRVGLAMDDFQRLGPNGVVKGRIKGTEGRMFEITHILGSPVKHMTYLNLRHVDANSDEPCVVCEDSGWVESTYQSVGAPNFDECPSCGNPERKLSP